MAILSNDDDSTNAWTPEKLAQLRYPRVRVKVHHKDGEVSVKCCYCMRMHRHSGRPIPGPRKSHCQPGGEYVLMPKGGDA